MITANLKYYGLLLFTGISDDNEFELFKPFEMDDSIDCAFELKAIKLNVKIVNTILNM